MRLILVILCWILACGTATAGGRVVLYGQKLSPQNTDAKEVSRDGYGLGLSVAYPMQSLGRLAAISGGVEWTNLLSESEERIDRRSFLRTEVETSQSLVRLYLGGELGSHGRGFFRPHVGSHLALMVYVVDVNVRIPDDSAANQDLVQDLETETEMAMGFDTVIGADFNVSNQWLIEAGVRYVKAFGVPQQLDSTRATDIYPDYFQIYVGVGGNPSPR